MPAGCVKLSKIRIYVHIIMRQGKGVSKPSEAIASFHEMKFAVVARLSEGRHGIAIGDGFAMPLPDSITLAHKL